MEFTFLIFTLISSALGGKELFYQIENNSKMPTVPMDTFNVSSDMKCGFKCAERQNCVGFNYNVLSQECHLLDRSGGRRVQMDYIHGAIGETLYCFNKKQLNVNYFVLQIHHDYLCIISFTILDKFQFKALSK